MEIGIQEFQRLRKLDGAVYLQDTHGGEYLLIQGLLLHGVNSDGKAEQEIITIEEQELAGFSRSDGSAASGYKEPPV